MNRPAATALLLIVLNNAAQAADVTEPEQGTANPWGGWTVGLKQKPPNGPAGVWSWRGTPTHAMAVAGVRGNDGWSAYANLGRVREHGSGSKARILNLAAVWAPHANAELFATVQATTRREVFGSPLRTAGARWWLLPGQLGLDLSRRTGADSGAQWALGLVWHGPAF